MRTFPKFCAETHSSIYRLFKERYKFHCRMYYENDDGTFVKRYRPSLTPFLVELVLILRCFHPLTHPITCTLKYDVNVFQILKRRVPLKLLTRLEEECLVCKHCIHVYKEFSEIQGLSK